MTADPCSLPVPAERSTTAAEKPRPLTAVQVDVVNVLNHPNFGVPATANLSINAASFGRITTATGNRRFTIGARVNF